MAKNPNEYEECKTVSSVLKPDDKAPNSRLPMILYHHAFDPSTQSPDELAHHMEFMFHVNGYSAAWRAPMFDYDHYHANAH